MPAYLTPARFKKMAFGIDVSELEDVELAALCSQASAIINEYCRVPRLPQMHDFRGGTIVHEEHSWRYPESPFDIGQRKAFPLHWPILGIDEFRIYVTNIQYVGISPTDLFVNNGLKYVEVVSLALTSAGLFNALVIPNIGLAQPTLLIGYRYGWDFVEPGEILYSEDGQTFAAQNQWWYADKVGTNVRGDDIGAPPVIKVDGVVQTTGFTINYDDGTVTFDSNQAPDIVVTAAYHFKLPWEIQWAAGHIVAWLHAEAEQHARGMAHLNRLRIGEVEMMRPRVFPANAQMAADLEMLIPEAAMLLATYRFDQVAVRI